MRVSIIIKTLNEARHIERAVRSALAAADEAGGGEVIVADSLSSDATVEIAARFPVRIVQLLSPEDRSCGVGAQLGFAVAQGEYLYILDGDMCFEPGFLAAAIAALDADAGLAGVGGRVQEMTQANEEFTHRARRAPAHMRPGAVDRLDMGGLYRRSALQQVGYFTNRNLHAYEEFELAARLGTAGWRLARLDVVAVRHYGHTLSNLQMLARRWRSRHAWGCGELLRQAWGQPHFGFVLTRLHVYRVYGLVLAWLGVGLLLTATAALARPGLWPLSLLWAATPFAWMTWRRRSLAGGAYAVAAWLVYSGGLLAGALRSARQRPTDRVAFARLQ